MGATAFEGMPGLSPLFAPDDAVCWAAESAGLIEYPTDCLTSLGPSTLISPVDPDVEVELDSRGSITADVISRYYAATPSCSSNRHTPIPGEGDVWPSDLASCIAKVNRFLMLLTMDPHEENWIWAVLGRLAWDPTGSWLPKPPEQEPMPPYGTPEDPYPTSPPNTDPDDGPAPPQPMPTYRDQVWWRLKWALEYQRGPQPQWAIDEVTDQCLAQEQLAIQAATTPTELATAEDACRELPVFAPGSDVGEAAQHDYDAIFSTYSPRHESTFATGVGSQYDGQPIASVNQQLQRTGKPSILHRIASQRASWLDRVENCSPLRPRRVNPNPIFGQQAITTLDCDEYPFATSAEGGPGAGSTSQASLRLISRVHNNREGRHLGAFYDRCSVESGGAFLVLPVPGAQATTDVWDENGPVLDGNGDAVQAPVMTDFGASYTFIGTSTFFVCDPAQPQVIEAPTPMPRPGLGHEYDGPGGEEEVS